MKLCILVLAFVAVAWAYPTGEKSDPLPAVPLVITDYSSVVKDTGVHPQKDAPQDSSESNESSESDESSEVKPAPVKPIEVKPIVPSIDSKPSEEQPLVTEAPKPVLDEKKVEKIEEVKPAEPAKVEDVKLEEPKFETKTLAHDDDEIPAPVALPTETKTDELPKNILEAASQPAAIAEDTIPLTSAKREEPEEEKEIKKPAIPVLKAEEGHSETVSQEKPVETVVNSEGSSEFLRSPATVAETENKVEPIVPVASEHPVVKSGEIHAEKVEEKFVPKTALPEPVPVVEEKHEIVTQEKKEETPKIKAEHVEPVQEGRTVRDAIKEEAIKLEEEKPIAIEKKDEKIEELALKKVETVAEEVKPIVDVKPIVEVAKPIVEEEKLTVKTIPKPHVVVAPATKQVSSEESVEESIELKKDEKPLVAEEVPKPLALPSAEKTPLLKKVEAEKHGEGVKVPAAIASSELPTAVF